jgi:hypothetical protein
MPHQIQAITGHQSLKEVTRYTEAADKEKLSSEAIERLVDYQKRPIKRRTFLANRLVSLVTPKPR